MKPHPLRFRALAPALCLTSACLAALAATSCQEPAAPPPPPTTAARPAATAAALTAPAVRAAKPVPAAASKTTPAAKPIPAPLRAGKVTEITLEQTFTLQQEGRALIFDARPSFVYAFGHLPGAINWPRRGFEGGRAEHLPQLEAAAKAGRPVVLYCTDAACPDARAVADRLGALGHDVSVMAGGYASWKEAGLPTE